MTEFRIKKTAARKDTIIMLNIRTERTKNPKTKPEAGKKLPFGKIFTDHMFMMNYTEGRAGTMPV